MYLIACGNGRVERQILQVIDGGSPVSQICFLGLESAAQSTPGLYVPTQYLSIIHLSPHETP